MPKRIYVSSMPESATTREIADLFAPYGKVTHLQIEGYGRARVATVELSSDAEADSALKGLANAKMGSTLLNVNEARPRT